MDFSRSPGATDTQALGINDTGQVAGLFFDANGNRHGFLATPQEAADVPEPSTLTLFGLGALSLLGCARRCRKQGKG